VIIKSPRPQAEVAIAEAVPIKCTGKISELIAHAGVELPAPKLITKSKTPANARNYPIVAGLTSVKKSKYIPVEMVNKLSEMRGKNLNIMYLRPSLSIIRSDKLDPTAFVKATGIFSRTPDSSLE